MERVTNTQGLHIPSSRSPVKPSGLSTHPQYMGMGKLQLSRTHGMATWLPPIFCQADSRAIPVLYACFVIFFPFFFQFHGAMHSTIRIPTRGTYEAEVLALSDCLAAERLVAKPRHGVSSQKSHQSGEKCVGNKSDMTTKNNRMQCWYDEKPKQLTNT